MDAPRGRGGGRGGGRGRTGNLVPRGAAPAVPLAAQMRQVLRLEEPKEMAILRRFKDLGASRVRSVYGQTGLLEQEVFVPSEVALKAGYENVPTKGEYITLLDAEQELGALNERLERERALARREIRLPEARRRATWVQLTQDERRILLLSQKEWNSFRVSPRGGKVAAGAATPPSKTAISSQEEEGGH
jgi:hypothetical protein